jgi:crotonobetainyl-CoA:carnitine CoA-transferase CaiB-like acyl-CoA transferase
VQFRGLRARTPHAHAADGYVDLIQSPYARMSESPATIRSAPPLIGEHTEEILGEIGYDAEKIAAVRSAGAV